MRLLSMHIKFGHWKRDLVIAWRDVCGVSALRCCSGRHDPEHARAVHLLRVLRHMCKARHDAEGDGPWVASVGKNVTHCTGPLAICLSLGVIKKLGAKKGSKATDVSGFRRFARRGVLRLGVHGHPYRLCSLQEGIVAVKRLRTWVVLADRIGTTVAPRTCRQWISAYKRMHGIMYETQPRHIKPRSRCIAHVILSSYFIFFI